MSWANAAKSDMSWNSMSWTDQSWSDQSWSDQAWLTMSWTDMSWNSMSWTDMSWTDMSWTDMSAEDAAEGDSASSLDGVLLDAADLAAAAIRSGHGCPGRRHRTGPTRAQRPAAPWRPSLPRHRRPFRVPVGAPALGHGTDKTQARARSGGPSLASSPGRGICRARTRTGDERLTTRAVTSRVNPCTAARATARKETSE